MLFNSFLFAGLFLPLTLLAFWGTPGDRGKRIVLLGASLVFYGWFFWPYLALLVGLVAVAWACALAIEKHRQAAVWVAAIALLGTLAWFKYAGFLATIASDVGLLGGGSRRVHELALPLGISFIVFQALGYVVDVYRGEFPAERRFSVVLLFKAFFPQLIAGPICRAHELMPQLRQQFRFDAAQFVSGLAIFAVGLLLKEMFADSLAPLVDTLYAKGSAPPDRVTAWAASIGFGAQIYADFWGYSTMAVGLARMFGIVIPVNFRLPYLATSLREFWRRWHITLSQWLRDYLYKPLGGSRHGTRRTTIALLATMLLGGIWHGANYTFVVWGLLHGVVLALEHLLRTRGEPQSPAARWAARLAGWSYVFVVVFIGWVFFRAADVAQALVIVKSMFAGASADSWNTTVRQVFALSALLFVVQVPIEHFLQQLREARIDPPLAVAASFWIVIAAVVFGAPGAVPFIYFQF